MKHPFVIAVGAGLAILLLAFLAPLMHMVGGGTPAAGSPQDQGLPWQTQVAPDGSLKVFGLALGRTRLADAQATLGDSLQIALVGKAGDLGALEGLVEPFAAGFVSGRLVLAFDVPPATLARWREHSKHSEAMEGGLRRFDMSPDDRDDARQMPLVGLSFVPSVRLSEADVRQRFGAPSEVMDQPDGAKALLYPDRGLVATVSAGSKGVLQYVAPAQFEARLRAPLLAAKTTSSAASGTK
jgi:hypothetical protein